MENYYALLGVSPEASLSEIKRAYRKKAKEFHPDVGGDNSEQFAVVAKAYEILSDVKHRALFDSSFPHQGRRGRTKAGKASFDYRAWLLARTDEESRCKLVLFDLLHNREDDAVAEYLRLSAGKDGFLFARWFSRSEAMDFGFILAEELTLRNQYYEAALLLLNIMVSEKRSPYFRTFFPEVVSFTKFVLLRQTESGVSGELALDAWEKALELDLDSDTNNRLLHNMGEIYEKMGDMRNAARYYQEAFREPRTPDPQWRL
ncbi:MAG: DnaJ domain-containing protein [Treponema sp.]|nr:DnaJ domain-containing protein [Treponema sp.]